MSLLYSSRALTRSASLGWVRRCHLHCFKKALKSTSIKSKISESELLRHKTESFGFSRRDITSSSSEELNENSISDFYQKQVEKRLAVLGKNAVMSCLTKNFLDMYPELDALKIANLVSHVTKEILPHKMDSHHTEGETMSGKRARMYVKIGNIVLDKGTRSGCDELKKYINDKFSNSEIGIYSKLAHPVPLLKSIAMKLDKQLEIRKKGLNTVEVFIDDMLAATVTASSREKSEYEACLAVLKEKYMDEVKNVALESEDEVLIREFKDKFDGQRVVELAKGANDETYGIYLKGGEKATKQTEKFWVYNYIEPIFINKIQKGSPADVSGKLQEGDVILAVGEYTLNGMTLKSAVSMINRENNVALTVKYDPEVKLRSKIKGEFIAMENRSFKETLKSDKWKRWHEAQAEKNPDRYVDIK